MEEITQLFQYIESKNKTGEFVDVSYYLLKLGYTTYESKRDFVDQLVTDGYLKIKIDPLSMYSTTKTIGFSTDNFDENIDVQITTRGRQYMLEHKKSTDGLRISRWGVFAAWVSGLVALALLVVTIIQAKSNKEKDNSIADQNATIIQLRGEVSRLSKQKDSLSSYLRERKSLLKNASKLKPDQK